MALLQVGESLVDRLIEPLSEAIRSAAGQSPVTVARDLASIETAWREAEQHLTAAPYQRFSAVSAWFQTIGRTMGAEPAIVIARGPDRRVSLLLPLAVTRDGPLRVARLAGGAHMNFAVPMFSADGWAEARKGEMGRVLIAAAEQAEIDAFFLPHQPTHWNGFRNPLSLVGVRPSANTARRTEFTGDSATDLRRLRSAQNLKKLRAKERKLASIGAVRTEHAEPGSATALAILDAFFRQKARWFASEGISDPFATREARAFYRRLTETPDAGLTWSALYCGDEIVATFAGLTHQNRYCGMVNSFAFDRFGACSPGDILLRDVMARCSEHGILEFDLGVGAAEYKSRWLDLDEPLVDGYFGVGPLGFVAAEIARCAALAKRQIKASPRLLALSRRLMR